MDIKIVEQRENPLLNRKEVRFIVEFTGATPSRKDVKQALCDKLGADASKTVIDKIEQGFGKMEIKGYVKVYGDEKAMKIEKEYKIKRDLGVKEEKKVKEKKAPPKKEGEAGA
jgi:small subunit ribosomal protein S24e